MRKLNPRIDDKDRDEETKKSIKKGTFFKNLIGIDPGRVHMAAVAVERFENQDQDKPSESLEFFVEQPEYAHYSGQNTRRFQGQINQGTNGSRWIPLSKKKRHKLLQRCEEKWTEYAFSKRNTRLRKARKMREKKEAKVCIVAIKFTE